MSENARQDEEQSTLRRARILGLPYLDTSGGEQKQLFKDLLTVPELYQLRVIPVYADSHNINFGITNTTSQQTIAGLRSRFQDQRLSFGLISDAGFR